MWLNARIIRSTGGATHIWRRKVAEKEALELQKLYLQQLTGYKDNHKEMNEAHASFVNKLIGSTRKLITIMKVGEAGGTDMERPRIAEQRRSKKGSKASKAPFELFCVSKADK
ncbi:hypothetical protein Tcan_07623 [Toxocara canis]|uniref:Uncharacterized protein n=1 Tax=Toxocara canis TaxID=6265 RepID=A0A0B2V264_TOXCA|nr:hypothetical protein Tcan_07623 [Toxocara canis]